MSQKQKKKSFSPSPEPEVFEDAFDVKAIEGHRNDRGHIKFHVRVRWNAAVLLCI